jgi:ABC-type nickel/cobalt efflux system permease component RcnA
MGNFSISHYAQFRATPTEIRLLYLLDFAEIPTLEEIESLPDGKIQPEEQEAFLTVQRKSLQKSLVLTLNGAVVTPEWKSATLTLRPGSGSLNTALLRLEAVIPLSKEMLGKPLRVAYEDKNYSERVGWREIVARAEGEVHLEESNVPETDRSKELTAYPTDLTNTSPTDTKAAFVLVAGKGTPKPLPISVKTEATPTAPTTRQDAFTQTISIVNLTPFAIAFALGTAFFFGAVHALSPGHGKAMVASYLVGVRGTARHALMLGIVVTITHTIGVYLLGFLAMFASKYVVPQKIYPYLSLFSGLAVLLVGFSLLWRRWRVFSPHREADSADNESESASDEVVIELEPEADISFRELLLLGMSGGALPCPTALIVMLSAIALNRIAFGMILILVFSTGLAVVLTLLGLLALRAKQFWQDRSPNIWLTARLPLLSALLVTGIGLYLVLQTLSNWGRFGV